MITVEMGNLYKQSKKSAMYLFN